MGPDRFSSRSKGFEILLSLFFPEQHNDRKDERRDPDGLRYGKIAGDKKPPGIAAEEFEDKTGNGIKE
jgi:hypothetical protein